MSGKLKETRLFFMNQKAVKLPFFEIGPKSYLYGDDILDLALAADAASEK